MVRSIRMRTVLNGLGIEVTVEAWWSRSRWDRERFQCFFPASESLVKIMRDIMEDLTFIDWGPVPATGEVLPSKVPSVLNLR